MNAKNVQIKALFEQGVSPEQIVEVFPDLSLESVKTLLINISPRFRKMADGPEGEKVFTKADREMAAELALELMNDSETPAPTRAKLLRFVIDEEQGRNNLVKTLSQGLGGTINVSLINLRLAAVDERYHAAKKSKVIDLRPEDMELLKAE